MPRVGQPVCQRVAGIPMEICLPGGRYGWWNGDAILDASRKYLPVRDRWLGRFCGGNTQLRVALGSG